MKPLNVLGTAYLYLHDKYAEFFAHKREPTTENVTKTAMQSVTNVGFGVLYELIANPTNPVKIFSTTLRALDASSSIERMVRLENPHKGNLPKKYFHTILEHLAPLETGIATYQLAKGAAYIWHGIEAKDSSAITEGITHVFQSGIAFSTSASIMHKKYSNDRTHLRRRMRKELVEGKPDERLGLTVTI